MMEGLEVEDVKEIARRAGEEVLEVYGDEFDVDVKEDASPLTEADRRSNRVILEALERLHPEVPVISEEMQAVDYETRRAWEWFWLVDPLDGTKEFIKRNGEFTVNIALVRGRQPVLGVVHQPVGDCVCWAVKGRGAWKSTRDGDPVRLAGGEPYTAKSEVTVVASRSHATPEVEAFVARLEEEGKTVRRVSAGSSLKICLVAEGAADLYPRLGPTMEWDTAAAHAVAMEAGREVRNYETGEPLLYNKEDLHNPSFVVA